MTTLKKVQLCDECRTDGGFHYDEDGNASRCPNIAQAKLHEEALKMTAEANRHAFEAARLIIADAARLYLTVSSNSIRDEMDHAGVPGPVRGAAFRQSIKDGVLRSVGSEPSTQQETHDHHVRVYESLIYRGRRAS